jgi:MFS transporter, DHA2 family, multidrug resistance protein
VDAQQVHARRWVILGVLVVSLLVVALDNTILNVALPTIQDSLSASQSQQQWILDSYVLVFAGLLFTFGVLGDRWGRRRMLVGGLAVFGLGSFVSVFATSAEHLIATRALMGVGAAAIMPSTLSIISNVFEPGERGKAIGIWAGFTGLGVAIGPVTGGLLLEHYWWGSVFLVNVPVAIVGITAATLLVPDSKDPAPSRLDPVGVLLSIVGLVALVFGIIEGPALGWGSAPVLGSLGLALLVLGLFVTWERRIDYPALDVTLFRNPTFSASTVAISLAFFALFGSMFFLTFYLQFARGYTPLEAGLRLLPVAAALAVFAPLSARLVARLGARVVCATGLGLVTVSFLGYQLVELDTPYWVLGTIFFVTGLGMANTIAPATTAIMSTLPKERAGAGSAVNNTTRQVGGALGVAVLGSLLSSAYAARVAPVLEPLPVAAREAASESLGATLMVADRLGRPDLVAPAQEAFVSAMHVAALGSAVVAGLGAVVVAVFLPDRDAATAGGLPAPPPDEATRPAVAPSPAGSRAPERARAG